MQDFRKYSYAATLETIKNAIKAGQPVRIVINGEYYDLKPEPIPEELDTVTAAAMWANNYIIEYNKGDFDPIRLLEQKETRHKLATESTNFLHEIEEAADRYRATRDKIARA